MRPVQSINSRMSLRKPQRESLELLDHVLSLFNPSKDQDVAAALDAIRVHYPNVEDFEREFPSICFAIATGVGKTRLMGAFITYLFLTGKSRHFFILAPNLTIYEKLISDFSTSSPKYVFKGISEFVNNPPVIITGDNYDTGKGVRQEFMRIQGGLFESIHVNIFNISKINSEVRGNAAPRIKRLQEYVGQSYFDYLSELDDLVLIMDEAHRYRATQGAKAINDLRPILGIELTATPQVETGTASVPFKNVIYQYALSKALDDGYIKEPAVATRKDFRPQDYDADQLERIKLEDGIHNHENVKVQLEVYARNSGREVVKPFMLVIAQDTDHASVLRKLIEDDSFFDGRYQGKVVEIHSNQRGDEKDENVWRLLAIERADEDAEVVIHVNKLKEGWDVTNLYTIVPLRAASSRTLVEQSIGRGLRLPYGERVGVSAVDRLTIIAHDRFQEIIDAANDPNSIIRKSVIIGSDVPAHRPEVITVPPLAEARITAETENEQVKPLFQTEQERHLASITLKVLKKYEYLPTSQQLKTEEIRRRVAEEVREIYSPAQLTLEGITEEPDVASVVETVTNVVADSSIDIPNVIVAPAEEVSYGFNDFDLNPSSIHLQPVQEEILLHYLQSNQRETLVKGTSAYIEPQLENYVVRALVDHDVIAYDEHSALLYKLAKQVVAHLESYLTNERDVLNVLQYHQKQLGDLVFAQMMEHYWETSTDYLVKINRGFTLGKANNYQILAGDRILNFKQSPESKREIRSHLFGGFSKCCYPIQKFDVDTERLFAVILEDPGNSVIRWLKPAPGVFRIEYRRGQNYEPDFVVETSDFKYICEPKAAKDLNSDEVQLKAKAAVKWCEQANEHATANQAKPWRYVLIPHDAILSNASFEGLVAGYSKV